MTLILWLKKKDLATKNSVIQKKKYWSFDLTEFVDFLFTWDSGHRHLASKLINHEKSLDQILWKYLWIPPSLN